ncbi:MAG: helix-turn-helix domain-containing protein [Alphaproteobacteria bacterium]|nr:helix-turn-helix domain-containing protein [Alphaproteobacteria bacterium]
MIGIDRSRIKAWVKRFSEEGLAGLEDRPRKPKRSKLSEAQKAEVIRWVDTGRNHAGRDIN